MSIGVFLRERERQRQRQTEIETVTVTKTERKQQQRTIKNGVDNISVDIPGAEFVTQFWTQRCQQEKSETRMTASVLK